MKKLILLELAFLFLATTFQSDNPPGWYQQTLPVNDFVNDIFFLDSLNGWAVTQGNFTQNDTGYILSTSNGGANWTIQFSKPINLKVVFMVDTSLVYIGGGTGSGSRLMYKTINGGISWDTIINSFAMGKYVLDINFLNRDTGWYCDDDIFDGGIFKTTNGGGTWVRQLNETYRPTKVFFINKDTGWASCNMDRLYRTTNGGINWNLQFTSAFPIGSIFFLNGQKGWMRGGPAVTGNGASYSIDGGFTWTSSTGTVAGGYDIKFVNDSIGYSGGTLAKIPKSTDGGKNWGYQISPTFDALQTSVLRADTLLAWMGSNGFIHTNDGGGTLVNVKQTGSEIPDNFKLNQNYPNPFNPRTIINYELRITGYIKLKVFDIQGKEIAELVNSKQGQGNYNVDFDGSGLSSGVYFYEIKILDEKSNNVFTDTKKMVLSR